MALFSDADVNALVSCPKELFEPPARALKLVGADWRNGARLIATDGTPGVFAMFMRRNDDFPENFSVGLRYNANDGRPEITLFRCNGKHGIFTTGAGDATHPHWDFHIHRASEAAQDAGFAAEKFATRTGEFASYEQAVQYFIRAINLKPPDIAKHFPENTQFSMFRQ